MGPLEGSTSLALGYAFLKVQEPGTALRVVRDAETAGKVRRMFCCFDCVCNDCIVQGVGVSGTDAFYFLINSPDAILAPAAAEHHAVELTPYESNRLESTT